MTWRDYTVSDADDCMRYLSKLANPATTLALHGTPKDWGRIVSRLDLCFEDPCFKSIGVSDRHAFEMDLLECFARDADLHLPREAKGHIEDGSRAWGGTIRHTGTMFVGRHFGLATRCVDWTFRWSTALFFACRRMHDSPAVVWWMDYNDFTSALERQWPGAYGKNGHVTKDFERDFQTGMQRDVLLRLHYPEYMDRATRQHAWVTVAGRYGVDHAAEACRLGVTRRGRVLIPAALKHEIIRRLQAHGVDGRSLGLGDSSAEVIASDLASAKQLAFAKRGAISAL